MRDQRDSSATLKLFLHHPAGERIYICISDESQRAFDFSDNTFKLVNNLHNCRDACIYATQRHEPRADHACSYEIEFDSTCLLKGTDVETMPGEGAKITVHWLRQVGNEPDFSADKRLTNDVTLRNANGRFQPANSSDVNRFDESRAFEQREKLEAEYREFVLREADLLQQRHERLVTAVSAGSVGDVLRVLAEDIGEWARNLKHHCLHQIIHSAKDPMFVRMRAIPKDSPFQVYEPWVMRDWIGSREAYDLIEFRKGAEYASSFSTRLDRLHAARNQFCRSVIDYTVRTRGEEIEGVYVLDEARKDLKSMALGLAEHLDVIALQFDADQSRASVSRIPVVAHDSVAFEPQVGTTSTTSTPEAGPLVIDESAFTLFWRGSGPHELGNRKEFHLLVQLWSARNRYVTHRELAERLGGDEHDKITHIKSRLVKLLKDRGLADLAVLIETDKGHYRLRIS